MITAAPDFRTERVVINMSSDDARDLAKVFDRASRLPSGLVSDTGWFDLAESLNSAAKMADAGRNGDAGSDYETAVLVRGGSVAFSFEPGQLADDVTTEIESGIGKELGADWRAVIATVRSASENLAD